MARFKIEWVIHNSVGQEVARFEYGDESEAKFQTAKLNYDNGTDAYYLKAERVPILKGKPLVVTDDLNLFERKGDY